MPWGSIVWQAGGSATTLAHPPPGTPSESLVRLSALQSRHLWYGSINYKLPISSLPVMTPRLAPTCPAADTAPAAAVRFTLAPLPSCRHCR